MPPTRTETTTAAATNGHNSRHGDMPAAFITMISESVLSLLRVWATAMTSAIGASIMTRSGMIRPVMLPKTNSVCRELVIRSKSRIACVNQITTVKLTSVIRNATMVVRNTYQPIDPIGPDFPTDGPPKGRTGPPSAAPRREPISPQRKSFHAFTKWLGQGRPIGHAQQPVNAGAGIPERPPEPPKCTLHRGSVRFIWRYRSLPDRSGRTEP